MGVNIEAVRYYERVKMLPAPPHTARSRQRYGPVETRTFIRRARELAFTLDQIRALLAFSADGGEGTCAELRELATGHLAEMRAKIADLAAMERVLVEAVRSCDAGQAHGCLLIETLSRLIA
jgi:MerR family transcriptional regulator, mercuric resistance operon regulatory protein